ncbi:Pycsar system effector family protein [Actinoplanes rectilineatus]|uniref:Pycsar system effector family protein n=1 Tax=Actinoplanes rectilineatus TaxID=113571 RepID=UPI0012F84E16|nr:Pycsar system effector family protein [Actinoplanes rectilineatus]
MKKGSDSDSDMRASDARGDNKAMILTGVGVGLVGLTMANFPAHDWAVLLGTAAVALTYVAIGILIWALRSNIGPGSGLGGTSWSRLKDAEDVDEVLAMTTHESPEARQRREAELQWLLARRVWRKHRLIVTAVQLMLVAVGMLTVAQIPDGLDRLHHSVTSTVTGEVGRVTQDGTSPASR